MTQHSRQLIATADSANQPEMHTKVPARQRESVDAAVAQQKELPGKAFIQLWAELTPGLCGMLQGLPNALHIVDQHRVIDKIRIAVNAGGNTVANAPFSRSGEVSVVPQCGQRGIGYSTRHGCLWLCDRHAGRQHQ